MNAVSYAQRQFVVALEIIRMFSSARKLNLADAFFAAILLIFGFWLLVALLPTIIGNDHQLSDRIGSMFVLIVFGGMLSLASRKLNLFRNAEEGEILCHFCG